MITKKTLTQLAGATVLATATVLAPAQTSSPSPAPSDQSSQPARPPAGSTPSTTAPASGAQTTMPSDSSAGSTSSTSSGTSGATAPMSVSRRDRNFMRELAQQNLAEIEMAKLALAKSTSEPVRTYADRMLTDHNKALDDLRVLAQQKGVDLPTTPDVAHKSQLVMFKGMTEARFDKSYISKGGLNDHEKTQNLLIDITNRAQDPDLKSLSASMLPVVRQHHQLAHDMSQNKTTVR